jgi:peptidyl-prolyl cis-trans isomerase B (cyclophilin B)
MRAGALAALVILALLVISGSFQHVDGSPPCTGDTCLANGDVYVNATATLDTNWGTIVFMLYEEGAPITAANFEMLADQKFYDGIKFHRCIDNFVAQTGDPNSKDNNPYNDGMGGSSQTIPLEINATLTHEDGAVGMARSSDPNSASSQFYLCDGPQHGLDGNYSVFGITVQGLDVVKKIAAAPTWGYKRPLLKDHPIDDIIMTQVFITPGYWVNNTNVTSSIHSKPALSGIAIGGIMGGAAALFAAVAAVWYIKKRRGLAPSWK